MDEIEDILSEITPVEENNTTTVVNEVNSQTKSEEPQEDKKEPPKKIEVITGNGDLTISPVHEHLEVEKPKPKENRKIFIPEVKGTKNQTKKRNKDSSNNDNIDDENNY